MLTFGASQVDSTAWFAWDFGVVMVKSGCLASFVSKLTWDWLTNSWVSPSHLYTLSQSMIKLLCIWAERPPPSQRRANTFACILWKHTVNKIIQSPVSWCVCVCAWCVLVVVTRGTSYCHSKVFEGLLSIGALGCQSHFPPPPTSTPLVVTNPLVLLPTLWGISKPSKLPYA